MASSINAAGYESLQWQFYELYRAFREAPFYHLAIEACMVLWIIKLIFFTGKKHASHELTEEEQDDIIADWNPEPLVPPVSEDHPSLNYSVVSGKTGKYITINEYECLDMASMNFMGLVGNSEIEEAAMEGVRKYGVGSCGPRGFYGTVDVHLELEKRLSGFMECETSVLYSYGFATISSAIPAYSKRNDVIFVDEAVSFAIQKGLEASRSMIKYFKHCDMDDLERVMIQQDNWDKMNPKKAKLIRRFLIVEGVFMNTGRLAPLPELIALKYKYKVRLFIDETLSFATIGASGRGITEHWGVDRSDVDLISATLENSLASVGGFCTGTSFVVEHQRLSGQGYCFSASLPPLLAIAAIKALNIVEDHPEYFTNLQMVGKHLFEKIREIEGLIVTSDVDSPVIYITLEHLTGNNADDMAKLQAIVDKCISKGVALTIARILQKAEHKSYDPSIRLAVHADLEMKDADFVIETLRTSVKELL